MILDTRNKLSLLAAALLVMLAGVGLFAGTLNSPFTSDDIIVTIENPYIYDLSNIPSYFANDLDWVVPEGFADAPKHPSRYGLYRPLLMASYHLDALFHGPEPFGWRLTNLVFHLMCSLLVLALALRLTGSFLGALAAALLFVAHPIHVEALASLLGGRADLLACLFVLASWWVFLASERLATRSRWAAGCASALLFLCGLFSKENAAVLPGILLLSGWLLRGQKLREIVIRVMPHLAVLVLYICIRLSVVERIAPNDWSQVFGTASPVWIVLTILNILATYLRLVLVPYPLVHPDCYNNLPVSLSTAEAVLSAILIMGLLTLAVCWAIRIRKRGAGSSYWAFGLLLFFLCLVPVSHVIPFKVVMASRFLYLPSVAFCLVAGWLATRAFDLRRWLPLVAGIPVLMAFGAGTLTANATWTDPDRLYQELIECNPDSPDAYNNLGTARLREGKASEALAFFTKAARVAPNTPDPHYNIGLVLQRLGRNGQAERAYRKALSLDPNHGMAANNLGTLLEARGDTDGAHRYFRLAIQVDPAHPAPLVNLGNLLQHEGSHAEAEKLYRLALGIDPRLDEARFNLARLLEELKRPEEAENMYVEIIARAPGHAMAHNNLANLYAARNEMGKALTYYRTAIRLEPDCVPARFNLANLLFSQGQYQEAIEHLQKAVALRPEYLDAWIRLGYAQNRAGQKTEALRALQKAVELAPEDERGKKLEQAIRSAAP